MIVAIKEKDRVYLACNPRVITSYSDEEDCKLECNIPIWKVEKVKNCIMGSTGDNMFESDAARYDDDIVKGEIDAGNVLANIAPAIVEKSRSFQQSDKYGNLNNVYFIAKGTAVYEASGCGECFEINKWRAAGYGAGVACASLEMSEGLDVTERLKKAFEVAGLAYNFPAYPIAVMDTKDCRLKIIEARDIIK